MNFKYQHLAVGGTFDRFHLGHKSLLDKAFEISKHVSIGIVGAYCNTPLHKQNKMLYQIIEPYEIREKSVKDYLKSQNYLARTKIFPINDIYGPTLKNYELQALLVTKNTYPNAISINKARRSKNLKPLKIILSPLIKGEDRKTISSERIRLGEIDRHGHPYLKILHEKKRLKLPENLREKLRSPLGKVILGTEKTVGPTAQKVKAYILNQKPTLVISVGDIVTSSLLKANLIPGIQIIDYKSRRKNLKNLPLTNYYKSFINDPGTLTYHIAQVFNKIVKKYFEKREKQQIIIKGEEDLITLICILLAPLQSIVIYGHYDLGVIAVQVTEQKKKEIENILLKFH